MIRGLTRQVYKGLLRADCAFYASEMLRGAPETGGRFMLGPHHAEWGKIINHSNRLLAIAPRDHGKCAIAGSLITAISGERIPIEAWNGGEVWGYDPSIWQMVRAKSSHSFPNGPRECVRITTRTGRNESVTLNHRFATMSGWVFASDLQIGQRIAVAKYLPIEGHQELRANEAWLMGLLIGDGSLTGTNTPIMSVDPIEGAALVAAVRSLGWQIGGKGDHYTIHHAYARDGTGPLAWRRMHGMSTGSYDHRVPSAIFTATNHDVADFIAGLIDADGHISRHGGGMVEIYSVSKPLLMDVQYLLVRFGVVSQVSQKKGSYKGNTHLSWRLTVRGRSICQLAAMLRLRGKKQHVLETLSKQQDLKHEGGSIDLLPKEAYDLIYHSEHWFRTHGGPRYDRKYDLTRAKALEISRIENNPVLKQLAKSPVLWDEIVSIEPIGVHETYGITVPGLESYVGQGIINHNSYFWCLGFPLWMSERRSPGKIGYIFSATTTLAREHLAKIRDEVLGGGENGGPNPKFQHLLPLKKNSAGTIMFQNGSEIRARGFGSRVRGGHPHWIVADDVGNDDWIWSEHVRAKAIDYFLSAIRPMAVPGCKMVVSGTPFHALDLYNYLEQTGIYSVTRHPAIDAHGRPLWPARYTIELLEQARIELANAIRFSREYLCSPITDDSSLFPSYLFDSPGIKQPYPLGLPPQHWHNMGIQLFAGVDLAMSSSATGDFFVIFVMGMDDWGNRWVVDIIRRHGLGYQEQVDLIIRICKYYQCGFVFCEANQYQRVISDMVVRTSDVPIKAFYTSGRRAKAITNVRRGMTQYSASKTALDQGVPSLRMLLENGKLRIPWAPETRELVSMLLAEMQAFGWTRGKLQGVGSHDDIVMAMWIADQACQIGGSGGLIEKSDMILHGSQSGMNYDSSPPPSDDDLLEEETIFDGDEISVSPQSVDLQQLAKQGIL